MLSSKEKLQLLNLQVWPHLSCKPTFPKHKKFPSQSPIVGSSHERPPLVSKCDNFLKCWFYHFPLFNPIVINHLIENLISMFTVCTILHRVHKGLLMTIHGATRIITCRCRCVRTSSWKSPHNGSPLVNDQ